MSKKLEVLKNSLIKKERILNEKFDNHFATIKQANGQPLNDKRNGQATLNKWERQSESIRNQKESIEKTKRAIEIEEGKIMDVEQTNNFIPIEIINLVEKGELKQWRKHLNTFFVPNVDKARSVWDNKQKVVAHRYAYLITEKKQRTKFVRLYNGLNSVLNGSQRFGAWRRWRFSPSRTYGIDAENQCLINHKCVCGALNRHFCQTPVMPSPFFFCRLFCCHLVSV